MRRLVLAAVLALALAAPASAQERGEPVVGGGSFGTAPVLEPGRYRDTILPAEYLYYGFELAAGQSLHITLTHPDIGNLDVQDLGVVGLSARIHNPTRTTDILFRPEGDYQDLGFGREETRPLEITSPTAEAEPDDSDEGDYVGAGVWYLALHPYTGTGKPPRAEIPFTFVAEIRGTAQPNVTPEPTDTPEPTETATPTPTPMPVVEEADAGPPPTVAAVGGVAGILLGVAAGIARRTRRR